MLTICRFSSSSSKRRHRVIEIAGLPVTEKFRRLETRSSLGEPALGGISHPSEKGEGKDSICVNASRGPWRVELLRDHATGVAGAPPSAIKSACNTRRSFSEGGSERSKGLPAAP